MPHVEYGTIKNESEWIDGNYDLVVSYCYPRKIKGKILDGNIFNLHPAPLPEFKGGDPYQSGARYGVTSWAVTLHKMTEEYDEGELVEKIEFPLPRPPTKNELWYVSHSYAMDLLTKFIWRRIIEY